MYGRAAKGFETWEDYMGIVERYEKKKEAVEEGNLSNQTERAVNQEETAGKFAAGVKLKECKYCRMLIPRTAKICPNCKMRLQKDWIRNLVILLVLIALCGTGIYYYVHVHSAAEPVSVTEDHVETDEFASADELEMGVETIPVIEAPAGHETEEDTGILPGIEIMGAKEIADAVDAEITPESIIPEIEEAGTADEEVQEETAGMMKEEGEAVEEDEDGFQATEEGMDAIETDPDTEISVSDYTEEEFREICEPADYKAMLRRQELYLNMAVTVELTVIEQIDGGLFDENTYYLCAAEDKKGFVRYYVIRDDRPEDDMLIFEGDVLQVYGQFFDTCKIPLGLTEERTEVPALTLVYYDLLEE